MSPCTLIGLTYSPWTEKARWALDFCQIPYHYQTYSPLFGEMGVRFKTKRWRRKITVPILFTPEVVIMDSGEIAQWAHFNTPDALLFTDHDGVHDWNALSEKALAAGRALLTYRVSQNKSAMTDYLPPWLPRPLWSTLGMGIAKTGIAFFRFKYQFSKSDPEAWYQTLYACLEKMEKQLASQKFLLGSFSFADIAMAMALQFVKPVQNQPIRVPSRSAGCWETPDLQDRFGQLLEWRDQLYHHYRETPSSSPGSVSHAN